MKAWQIEMGKRIAAAREKLGLNQLEFGKLCGVSQPVVSAWESGNHQMRVSMLKKLVELTGEPSSYFLPEALHRRDTREALARKLAARLPYDQLAELVTIPEERLEHGLNSILGGWVVEKKRRSRSRRN